MLKHILLTTTGASFVLTAGMALANPDDFTPGPALLFEMMGTDYCETIPTDFPMDQMQAGIEGMQAEGQPLMAAEVEGFMAGSRAGISLFGIRDGDTGFGAVHSLWGPLDDDNLATLCIATIQFGDEGVATGRHEVIDMEGSDQAKPGQFAALGVVITLAPTGQQSDEGRDIYRQRIIGEVRFSSGWFELHDLSDEKLSAAMSLVGELTLENNDDSMPVRIDADIQGMPGLDNVPELSLND